MADDKPENILLLKAYLTREGYEVVTANDGLEAVRSCQQGLPDLIIMDAAMPGMNGFEATREIRRLYPNQWIPILFLSAYASDENQARGLGAGGDDYLSKPVNLAILSEKIKAMRRIADMQTRIIDYAARLEDNIEQSHIDQNLAKHLLERIIRTDETAEHTVQSWVSPAANFSGDVVVTTRGPSGALYVMMVDATGHGLAAAISIIPVIEAFYRLTEKGFSVASIVRELNRKIHNLMPRDRFVAAAIASIDSAEHSIQLWNGGNPTVRFLNAAGAVLREWPSAHPPLGVLPNKDLQPVPEIYSWSEPGQLIMYTDGMIEAESPEKDVFGDDRVLRILTGNPPDRRFGALIEAVRSHIGNQAAMDDISLVAIECTDLPLPLPAHDESDQPHVPVLDGPSWKVALTLNAQELKTLDIVPLLMGWLDNLHLEERHRGTAFIVLAELLNNAIDHGLLEMDSTLKHAPDGFERYMTLRAERLAALHAGAIDITIQHLFQHGAPRLLVNVRDSGPGFDYQYMLARAAMPDTAPFGRGIMLLRTLTPTLEYRGTGNEVSAVLDLS